MLEEEGREVSANIWLGQGGIGPNPGDTGLFPAALRGVPRAALQRIWAGRQLAV